MKSALVFLIVGIFFIGLSFFVLRNFSPLDTDKIQELISYEELESQEVDSLNILISNLIDQGLIWEYLSSNFYLFAFTAVAALFSLVIGIHLIIDKIFFKSLWQNPSYFDAARRAALISLATGLIGYLKFLRVENTTVVLIPISILVAEIIFISIKKDVKFLNSKGSSLQATSSGNNIN